MSRLMIILKMIFDDNWPLICISIGYSLCQTQHKYSNIFSNHYVLKLFLCSLGVT